MQNAHLGNVALNFNIMRNLFLTLSFMLIGLFSFGQSLNVIDYSSRISKEQKGTTETNSEIVTASEYSENLGGTMIVTGYRDGLEFKIISVSLVKSTNERISNAQSLQPAGGGGGCPNGYRSCARGCNDKPTELGVILCIGYCLIDCNGL